MSDITNINDIKLLVDSFYGKVKENEILSPVFENIIKDRWPSHLEKMYRFWQTMLLEEHTYSGSPFSPHAAMPIGSIHFGVWLELFFNTIDENFTGPKANEAKWRAEKMAEMFQLKMNHYKNNPHLKPL